MMFVDTSVIVTSSQPRDPNHHACIARLAAVESRDGSCALHSLSEVFAVLTRLPVPYRLPPNAALQVVKHTSKRFKVISLTPTEHLDAIDRFAAEGLSGAMVYDALILACARKVKATKIYTRDLQHFRRIAPDLASIIVEP